VTAHHQRFIACINGGRSKHRRGARFLQTRRALRLCGKSGVLTDPLVVLEVFVAGFAGLKDLYCQYMQTLLLRGKWIHASTLMSLVVIGVLIGPMAIAAPIDYPTAMALTVERWTAAQKPSGFFVYGFDFLEDTESENNTLSAPQLVRQALAGAVLADYQLLTGDKRAHEPVRKLLVALRIHSLPIGKSELQTFIEHGRVLSLPVGRYKLQVALESFGLLYEKKGAGLVLSPSSDYAQAHTGATALALLTEVWYYTATGDSNFADSRRAWLEALIGLRIPGAGFRQLPTSIDHTPYYDGEAWLALAEYHRAFPQDSRAESALADADADLLRTYGGVFQQDFFHWGTMAASARYRDTRNPRFLQFVIAQMSAVLQRKAKVSTDNTCALAEGVADGLAALVAGGEGTGKLANEARAWLSREMEKAEKLQIKTGQRGLAFVNARLESPRMSEFAGAFLEGTNQLKTQVDLGAHCVSAMIKIRRNALLR